MKKVVLTILIGFSFLSCDFQQTPKRAEAVADDNPEMGQQVKESRVLDSLAIGDIYLGINEDTFYKKKKNFLTNNPSLNGLDINDMIGKFYHGRLYSLIIRSIVTKKVGNFDVESKWISLYEEKYKVHSQKSNTYQIIELHSKDSDGNFEKVYIPDRVNFLLFKKGKCTIEVCDEAHFHNERALEEELFCADHGLLPPIRICSVIHIYDDSVIKQIENDDLERQNHRKTKSLDVI